ncbi:MAG TPA: serine hydrolase [Solirubrobacteraceae bacterium]
MRGTVAAIVAVAAGLTAAPASAVTLRASPKRSISGHRVVLSGEATPGATVAVRASPYPYRHAVPAGTALAGADGSFSLTARPDRNTRYRAIDKSSGMSARVDVGVAGRVATTFRALPLGRARVRLLLFHPLDLDWNDVRVRWSFASGAHGAFTTARTTRTRRLSRYVTALTVTVALPAGPFRWRACFRAPGDRALLAPRRPPECAGRGYSGGGRLPTGYPSPAAVRQATAYLRARTGRTAFAVIDSEGRMAGLDVHRTFVSASVVKAMLLVAYLRRLHAEGHHRIDAHSNGFLYPMINVSDNDAATTTWSIVGASGLYGVAHAAHMTDFSVDGFWADAQISPADQARFFFGMDALIPPEFRGYARFLLSTIVDYESWGIPAVARPRGYRVYFKGGWRGTDLGQLVHQVARVEGHGRTFAIAVMTDGDPSMGYGIDTIQGLTARLL